jgi:hypothetical protein
VATVFMVIFPPIRTTLVETFPSGGTFRSAIHYRLVFAGPVKDIQYLRLCLQCLVVWGLAVGLIATFRSRHKEEVTPQAPKKKYPMEQPIDRIISGRLRGE